MHVCMCVCVRVCMCAYICICMYLFIYFTSIPLYFYIKVTYSVLSRVVNTTEQSSLDNTV